VLAVGGRRLRTWNLCQPAFRKSLAISDFGRVVFIQCPNLPVSTRLRPVVSHSASATELRPSIAGALTPSVSGTEAFGRFVGFQGLAFLARRITALGVSWRPIASWQFTRGAYALICGDAADGPEIGRNVGQEFRASNGSVSDVLAGEPPTVPHFPEFSHRSQCVILRQMPPFGADLMALTGIPSRFSFGFGYRAVDKDGSADPSDREYGKAHVFSCSLGGDTKVGLKSRNCPSSPTLATGLWTNPACLPKRHTKQELRVNKLNGSVPDTACCGRRFGRFAEAFQTISGQTQIDNDPRCFQKLSL